MATWKLTGTDQGTDADVEIEIVAADEASALLAGLLRGIYVAQVRRVPAPAAPASPAPTIPPAPAKTSRPATAGPNPTRYMPAPAPAAIKRAAAPTTGRNPSANTVQRPAQQAPQHPPQPSAPPAAKPQAGAPRRVEVRRATGGLLPRTFADLLSVPQPPPTRRR